MCGCPSYRSKRWNSVLGVTQNHKFHIFSTSTHASCFSLFNAWSQSQKNCVLSELMAGQVCFKNREWTGQSLHRCHLPFAGEAAVRSFFRGALWRQSLLSCTSPPAALSPLGQKQLFPGFVFPLLSAVCLFGGEEVCFIGTGLLPCCFLCSLSQLHGPERRWYHTVSVLPGTISRISPGIVGGG